VSTIPSAAPVTNGRAGMPGGPSGESRPRLLFVNGFHRSGTTVTASAVTQAVGGVTTTVGALARHIPTLEAFLKTGGPSDRGADRLEVTADTTEEYGFLLHHRAGARALYGNPKGVPLLSEHVAELASCAPHATVVLKNPWDLGREAQMLADFPDARIIILRRRVADVERSVGEALVRTSLSPYATALEGGDEGHERFHGHIESRWKRTLLLLGYRLALRRRVWRLAGSVRRLPADRIAVLSYDELRADPEAGAAWAAHIVEPHALAQAFAALAFEERIEPASSSLVHRALDRRWRRAWERVRAEQVRTRVLAPPGAGHGGAGAKPRQRRRVRPVRAAVGFLLRAAPQLTPPVEKLLWRAFYELASLGRGDPGATLMNYGYAPLEQTEADASRGDDEFGLRLYAAVAGAVDLSGKDVLEVSCGRGGGAAFVFEQLEPRSVPGLDLATRAIARCRARYARPGLDFVAGDAENLPFADATFDAVLSVEASHCYSDTLRFLTEACRVLRPGGLLLLTDFRHTFLPVGAEDAPGSHEDVQRLHEQLDAAGFVTLEEEDITANVVHALQLDTPRRRARIERRVPRPLRGQALAFAAIEGGPMYRAFAEGNWTYLRFALRKC